MWVGERNEKLLVLGGLGERNDGALFFALVGKVPASLCLCKGDMRMPET